MLLDVKKIFEDYLKEKLVTKPDVLKFVLNHERKDLCIKNLCGQILIAEKKLGANRFKKKQFEYMIQSIAKAFAESAIEYKAQSIISGNERKLREQKADTIKEAEGMIKELEEFSEDKIKVFQTR